MTTTKITFLTDYMAERMKLYVLRSPAQNKKWFFKTLDKGIEEYHNLLRKEFPYHFEMPSFFIVNHKNPIV